MPLTLEAIVFYLLLLDSIGANILAWCCARWYKKKYKKFYKHFPATKGWALWYLILILWVGWALARIGIIL